MKTIAVELVDFTGACAMNPARYAQELLFRTRQTRLTRGEAESRVSNMSDEELAEETLAASRTLPSSWEFIGYTFRVQNVSRSFTHQFVRTRHASFAQQSLRTVDVVDLDECSFVPVGIQNDVSQNLLYMQHIRATQEMYAYLLQIGAQPEDARELLPLATQTDIYIRIDLRNLSDMVKKRASSRVQGQYREVLGKMIEQVLAVHPFARDFIHVSAINLHTQLEQLLNEEVEDTHRRDDIRRLVDRLVTGQHQ